MNNERRKDLEMAILLLEQAKASIEMVQDQEQDSYDNLPEGIQCSEKGETMENNVSEMEEVMDSIDTEIETLQKIIGT